MPIVNRVNDRIRSGAFSLRVLVIFGGLIFLGLTGLLFFQPGGGTGQTSTGPTKSLTLLSAAGLREPIEAIAAEYEKEFGVHIQIQYGGSNSLLNQIQVDRMSPNDLFLAADDAFTQAAVNQGLANEVFPVASQRPVVAIRRDASFTIEKWDDLLVEGRRISLGNPDQTAVGKSVQKALQKITTEKGNRWEQLEKQTAKYGVFKPTVNDVANDIRIGAVDVGIVWDATLASPAYQEHLKLVELPELANSVEDVSLAVLTSSEQPTESLKFSRYVAARDRGLKIFQSHGLKAVEGDKWEERPEINFFCGAVNRRTIERILDDFQKREGVTINTVFDGCGILTGRMGTIQGQQPSLGFPDVYMACDRYYLDNVKQWFQEDLDVSDVEIVMVIPKGKTLVRSSKDLIQPGIRVSIGQPQQCTIGALTKRLLEREGLYEPLMQKQKEPQETVVEKSSSALLVPDVVTGHVDVAIAYYSDALPVRDQVDILRFESDLNVAIQPLSIARTSDHKELIRRLYNTVRKNGSSFEANGFRFRLPVNIVNEVKGSSTSQDKEASKTRPDSGNRG